MRRVVGSSVPARAGSVAARAGRKRTALGRLGACLAFAAAALALPSAALVLAGTARAQDEGDFRATRTFRLPEARDARSLAESARGHVRGQRWGRALEDLQRLLEEHRGDVLGPSWHIAGEEGRAHPGAAQWAYEQLALLPEEARTLYRDRWGSSADAALAVARGRADRRALAEVAQRWPITDAARTAWWALGDLELELGHVKDALFAWQRAAGLLEMLELPLPPGATRRLEVAAAIARERTAHGTGDTASPLFLPGRTRSEGAFGPLPHEADATWRLPLEPHPYDTRGRVDQFNLFPVLAAGHVFLTTSRWVEAVDAFTGRRLWKSARPAGWDDLRTSRAGELEEAIDFTWGMVAPAYGEGVVVAALQIPYAKDAPKDFQNIPIKVSLPERRLFAFDADDGAPLWDHAPPHPWDGEFGTWPEHMSVAGPPVVAGTRVLVPCYRIQGRVELHVACYDLFTGEKLWSTQLVSGQRELNMFGRHEREFCAAPLRVEGDRVLALTQLGLLAALDLFSGRILWESLYEQLPLPSARSYTARRRDEEWRNTAPAVADGVVLATPTDSEYLTAFRLSDGAALWAVPRSRLTPLRSTRSSVNALIGADAETLYVDGDVVAAWRKPGGLASSGPPELLWYHQVDEDPMSLNFRPRAALGESQVLVPDRGSRLVLNRATGALESELPWPSEEVGNVVLGEGMFFSLGGGLVTGFFDWDVLLARAEADLEANLDDPTASLALARLCARRGSGLARRGFTADSLVLLERAIEVLEPWVTGDAALANSAPEASAELHSVLRAAAHSRADHADRAGALADLDRAERLAPDRAALRDTLFERAALLEARDPAGWLATLARLEDSVSDLPLSPLAPELRGAPWAPLPTDATASSGSSGALAALGRLGGGGSRELEPLPTPTVGLWVLYARADQARAELRDDLELEALHSALERYGDFELGGGALLGEQAAERIRLTVSQAPPGTYAPFEARAREALEAARASGGTRELEQVAARYPAAEAAEEARALLRRAALEAGEWETVVRTVSASLSPALPTSPTSSTSLGPGRTEDDARLALLLAEALGRSGNLDFEVGLVRSVARDWPLLTLEDGRTVAAHAEALTRAPNDDDLGARNHFDERLTPAQDLTGSYEFLGELPRSRSALAETAPRALVVRGEEGLLCFRSGTEGVAWVHPTRPQRPQAEYWELFSDRVLFLDEQDRGVLAVDGETGAEAWHWTFPGRGDRVTLELAGKSGVAVVIAKDRDRDLFRAHGLDAHSGLELWTLELPYGTTWRDAVCGDDFVAFLPDSRGFTREIVVADLFLGRETLRIDPGETLTLETSLNAWAEENVLVLPNFRRGRSPEHNHLSAWDLSTGRRAWRWPLALEELARVVRVGRDTYLELSRDDGRGSLVQVMVPSGARRRILDLGPDDEFLGLERTAVYEVQTPWLFLWTVRSEARSTPLTAVHLPYGKRWERPLPVGTSDLYRGSLPIPVTSDTTAVVSYTTSGAGSQRAKDRHLVFLDLETGELRDKRTLSVEYARADKLTLTGLGERLLLVASSRVRGALMQVWTEKQGDEDR